MRSREYLRRLDRLQLTGEDDAKLIPDLSVLSDIELARLEELLELIRDGQILTTDEETEAHAVLNKCPLVDPNEPDRPSRRESNEERRERNRLRWSFGTVFRDFAERHPYLPVPNYAPGLNAYREHIGWTLLERYGWVPGERNTADILPLDQWAPGDREAIIDLYSRANP